MMRYWMLILLFSSQLAFAQTTPVSQAEVQSVFLFHFTSFVDWPAKAFSSPSQPLVIGILGKNPFGKHLEDVIRNEKKGEHPIVVKYFSSPEEIGNCHILYIVKTTPEDLNHTLSILKGRNILTVGDSPYFTNNGGMIKFFTENNKVRLQVNKEAANKAELTISSKLLRVAEVINSAGP